MKTKKNAYIMIDSIKRSDCWGNLYHKSVEEHTQSETLSRQVIEIQNIFSGSLI